MLVLPIVNRNRVLNVKLRLKQADKVKSGVNLKDISESDIIVNGKSFLSSGYSDSHNMIDVANFIRHNSLIYKRNFHVTTRQMKDSSRYDVYEVGLPMNKVNNCLDELYSSAIIDIQKEIPKIPRGRYVSLAKFGLNEVFSDEKVAKIRQIVLEERNQERWPQLFKEAGVMDLPNSLEFLNLFDCTVISDTSIPEDSLQQMIDSMSQLYTKDARSLSKFYKLAQENRDIYAKMSYVNKLVYDRPLQLIQSDSQKKAKQLVKKEVPLFNREEGIYERHAA